MKYKVYRAVDIISLKNSGWESGCWKDIAPLELTYYMGEKPRPIPKTQVKVIYDSNSLYVIFRVEDKFNGNAHQHCEKNVKINFEIRQDTALSGFFSKYKPNWCY